MLVVGLTGGIGSGKSTVAQLFAEQGVPIIDADQVAKDITLKDQPAFKEIVNHFGNRVLKEDGTLNRGKLREIIFDDAQERLWLENALHPLIKKAMEAHITQLNAPYCIAVIPLLLEVEFYGFINRILVVDTPEHLQIQRTLERDNVDKSQVEAILKTQAKRQDRKVRAHDLINNEGDKNALTAQVNDLHQKYLMLSKSADYATLTKHSLK